MSKNRILKLTAAALGAFMMAGTPALAGKTKSKQKPTKTESIKKNDVRLLLGFDKTEKLLKQFDQLSINDIDESLSADEIEGIFAKILSLNDNALIERSPFIRTLITFFFNKFYRVSSDQLGPTPSIATSFLLLHNKRDPLHENFVYQTLFPKSLESMVETYEDKIIGVLKKPTFSAKLAGALLREIIRVGHSSNLKQIISDNIPYGAKYFIEITEEIAKSYSSPIDHIKILDNVLGAVNKYHKSDAHNIKLKFLQVYALSKVKTLMTPGTFEIFLKSGEFSQLVEGGDPLGYPIFFALIQMVNQIIDKYKLNNEEKLSIYQTLHNSPSWTRILNSTQMPVKVQYFILTSLLNRLAYRGGTWDYNSIYLMLEGKDKLFFDSPTAQKFFKEIKDLRDEDPKSFIKQRWAETWATCFKGLGKPLLSAEDWEAFIGTVLESSIFDPRIIFSNTSSGEKDDPIHIEGGNPSAIVANNTGYIENIMDGENTILGNSLSLEDGTPIGYNIHLPMGSEVKGMLVHVYGGSRESQREENAFRPSYNAPFIRFLLNRRIAYASLNLPDLLELKVFQDKMPFEVHNHIHAAIQRFYEMITEKPETLDPKLNVLRNIPIALYGVSFGGRTVVRHAELYPHTFTCYITQDGALSYRMLDLSNTGFAKGRKKQDSPLEEKDFVSEYLSPLLGIESLQDPVLVLHNPDDNNVKMEASLDFYKKAKEEGKDVSLFITEQGSPIGRKEGEIDLTNKGHFAPKTMEHFVPYMEAVVSFIVKGPSPLPEISDWRAYQNNLYTNKHYMSATFEERCIAEMFRIYKASIPFRSYQEYAAQIIDREKEETIWDIYYQPIFQSLYYSDYLWKHRDEIRRERKRIKSKELLTPEVLEKVAEHYLYGFERFIEECYTVKIPTKLNQKKILQKIVPQFQEWVDQAFKGRHNYAKFILRSLYMANPHLVNFEERYNDDELKMIAQQESNIRKRFIADVHENQRLTRETIRAVVVTASANRVQKLAKVSHVLLLEESLTSMEESFPKADQSYGTDDPKKCTQTLSSDVEVLLKNISASSSRVISRKRIHQKIDDTEFEEALKS